MQSKEESKERREHYGYRGITPAQKKESEKLKYCGTLMTLHVIYLSGDPDDDKSRFTIQVDENVWRMFQGEYGLDRSHLAWQLEDLKIALQLWSATRVNWDNQSRTMFDINEEGVGDCLHLSTINNEAEKFMLSNNPIPTGK